MLSNLIFKIYYLLAEVLQITVTADEYLDKLVDYSMMKIYAIATVQETQQTWAEEDDFMVQKPKLVLQVRAFSIILFITNSL